MDSSIVTQRAKRLRTILPIAVRYGRADATEKEPLKVSVGTSVRSRLIIVQNLETLETFEDAYQNSLVLTMSSSSSSSSIEASFKDLKRHFLLQNPRSVSDTAWRQLFTAHIKTIISQRSSLVSTWLNSNISRFPSTSPDILQLKVDMERALLDLSSSYRICTAGCNRCAHQCLKLYDHAGMHDCDTSHKCDCVCDYQKEHEQVQGSVTPCGLT
jgi:hypothetical protein